MDASDRNLFEDTYPPELSDNFMELEIMLQGFTTTKNSPLLPLPADPDLHESLLALDGVEMLKNAGIQAGQSLCIPAQFPPVSNSDFFRLKIDTNILVDPQQKNACPSFDILSPITPLNQPFPTFTQAPTTYNPFSDPFVGVVGGPSFTAISSGLLVNPLSGPLGLQDLWSPIPFTGASQVIMPPTPTIPFYSLPGPSLMPVVLPQNAATSSKSNPHGTPHKSTPPRAPKKSTPKRSAPLSPTSPTKKSHPTPHILHSCLYCNFTTPKARNLDSHVKTHASTKVYACAQCGAAFLRSHDLKRHEESQHAEEKAFECSNCGHCFARLDALKRHVGPRVRGGCFVKLPEVGGTKELARMVEKAKRGGL
ncbi:hypothetical protein HDU98_007479 [Podochytrium sp. JEL0797]|nr:hypothetical protein HDU98_007479 [Podochytrium sp. JEL0797]